MSFHTDLRDALDNIDDWPTKDAVVSAVEDALCESAYHLPEDCVRDEDENQTALLAEAVRILHCQAHNGSRDTLDAENCHSEPCRTVGAILASTDAPAQNAFPAGSRVA